MSTLTPEENEAIRKAAEDKAWAEDVESKGIETERKALASRLAVEEAALKVRKPKEYDLPKNGKMHDRLVLLPLVDEVTGQILFDINGNVQYVTRIFEDKNPAAEQELNYRLVGPWDGETIESVLVRQDGEMLWPDATGLSNTSSTSEIIDYLKTNGPFIGSQYNSSENTGNHIWQIAFYPPSILGSEPKWRDLQDTLSQEVEVLQADFSAQKAELAQLLEAQDNITRSIGIKENEILILQGIKQEYEDNAPELALAVAEALALRDSYEPGTPEYIAADAQYIIAIEEQELNNLAIQDATENLNQVIAEKEQLELDLLYTEDRIPIAEALVQSKAIGLFNLNNSVLELGASIGQAEDWRNLILTQNPGIENAYKEEQNLIKAAEAEIAKTKNDLAYLDAVESGVRNRIRSDQNKAAINAAQNIVGDGSINKKGELVAPTGAFAAAAARAQEVVNQLNKPVYTEKELVEIRRQNDEAKQIENFRASRTDKGKMGFSGCDITAVLRVPQYARGKTTFNENLIFQLGTLQTIAISTYNAKTPVKSIGFKNPIAIARGGRTIAGTMIFNQLHRHVFDDNAYGEVINDKNGFMTYSQGDTQYFIDSKEIRENNEDPYASAIKDAEDRKGQNKSATVTQAEVKNKIERFKPGTNKESYSPKQYDYVSFDPKKFKQIEGPWQPADDAYLADLKERQKAWQNNKTKGYLSDEDIKNKSYINKKKLKKQWDFSWDTSLVGERIKPSDLPPFDIIIMLVNEMGNVGKIILYGVEIIHDSQTLSVEDIYTEAQYQYIAKDIEYFHANDFEETKAWVSSLPIYGYKGFYLANIERAQKELNDFKSKMAQQAYDLAAQLGARSSGITDATATAKLAKEISLNRLRAELADLEKQLESLGDQSSTSVKDLQGLLFATRDLLAQKEQELKEALTSPTSDYAFWKVQLMNFRNRVNAMKEADIWQTNAGAGVIQVDQKIITNLFDWDEYFTRNNEYFLNDPRMPVSFPPFYPLLPFPAVTENPAKFVYEFFLEQKKISQEKLDEALYKFKFGDGSRDGYVGFWDNMTFTGTLNNIKGYPETGILAKKELGRYAERFPAYVRDKDISDKVLANVTTKHELLNDIFIKYPMFDRNAPIVNTNQISIEEVASNIQRIIQTDLGPKEFPQHDYYYYVDKAKVEQYFAEGIFSDPAGIDSWMEARYKKESDGRYLGYIDSDAQPMEIDPSIIDYTTPGILVKRTRNEYSTVRNDKNNNSYYTGVLPEEPYPSRISVKTAGGKDAVFEELTFKYNYSPERLTQALQALNDFTQGPFVPIAPLAIPPSPSQSLSSMTVYDYLLLLFMTVEEVNAKLTKGGYYNMLFEAVDGEGKPVPQAGVYLGMKVEDFFEDLIARQEEYRKNPLLASDYSFNLALKFVKEFLWEIWKKYTELRINAIDEEITNESLVEISNSQDSWTDLRNKVAFYEQLLIAELNKDYTTEREKKIKDLMDQINEKRRTILLVTTGTYDEEAEATRASLLSNTQSGPAQFGGGVRGVPITTTAPYVIPSATSLPEEPEDTGPAPEQTNLVRPPREL